MIWIALLRGINVGGNNILPMADLREIMESLKFKNARTYIQSGNAIFESRSTDPEKLSKKLSDAIEKTFSFRPRVMVVQGSVIDQALANNPFPQAADEPKNLHMFFMTEAPEHFDEAAFKAIQKPGELFAYKDNVFYLYAPNGIWKSKIGAKVEKMLGVDMTARNLRTVMKLKAMLED